MVERLKECDFCTGWTDGFAKERPDLTDLDWLGRPICIECAKHIMGLFNGKMQQIADEGRDKGIRVFKGDKQL